MKTVEKLIPFGLLVLITACGDSAEHKAAMALDAEIDSAIANREYAEAVALIDSLNRTYATELELRRASNSKRLQALEGLTMQQIPVTDSILAANEEQTHRLMETFVEHRSSPSLPPYLLPKAISGEKFVAKAGVQPRVNTGQDAQDTPWTLAVNAGRNIKLTQASVSTDAGTTITVDCVSADGQIASIPGSRLDAALADGAKITSVALTGETGTVQIAVTSNMAQAISECQALAMLQMQRFNTLATREKLERQLQIARDQQANVVDPNVADPQN